MSVKIRILICDGMSKDGVAALKEVNNFEVDLRSNTPADELARIIGNAECLVVRSATIVTKDLIEKASAMRLIVRAGAGVDNIDVKAATERNIPVMNTASANSLAAAEQTIALLFSMLRMIPQSAHMLREGKWDRKNFTGVEATGKLLGVLGLGNIGRIVAEKAVGLGMKVIGYDPLVKSPSQLSGPIARMDESILLVPSVDQVMSLCDILTVHIPKTPETTKLVNADRISRMKKGAFVLNCSRGGIVDEKAVIAGLDSGQLAGAAFDVYEKEPPDFPNALFTHPKIVCTPHLGASTQEALERVGLTASRQIIGFFCKDLREGVVNSV